ncbi:hypothetical protein CEB3_c17630 [Peptococcaceae bacterium CEB3]|nr:hypothetical protein CEB3_c17630 [Peptococcaceae bacterium CEB3]
MLLMLPNVVLVCPSWFVMVLRVLPMPDRSDAKVPWLLMMVVN